MGLINAGAVAGIDRYIKYQKPNYNREVLDKDRGGAGGDVQIARPVVQAVNALLTGRAEPTK